MGQKKASGYLPCRAIRRMIDLSPLDFFLPCLFFLCTVAHGEKVRPTGGLGHAIQYIEMHTVDAVMILSCICIHYNVVTQGNAVQLYSMQCAMFFQS